MRTSLPLFHPDVVQACLEAIGRDPDVHALLVGLTTMGFMAENMRRLGAFAQRWRRPVLVSAGVGGGSHEAVEAVRAAGLPVIGDAERTIQVLAALLNRPRQLVPRLEAPTQVATVALAAGSGPLSTHASLEFIERAGLPTAHWGHATSEEQAAE